MAGERLTRIEIWPVLSVWITENRPRLFGKKWFDPEWQGIADNLIDRLERSNIGFVRLKDVEPNSDGWFPGSLTEPGSVDRYNEKISGARPAELLPKGE